MNSIIMLQKIKWYNVIVLQYVVSVCLRRVSTSLCMSLHIASFPEA